MKLRKVELAVQGLITNYDLSRSLTILSLPSPLLTTQLCTSLHISQVRESRQSEGCVGKFGPWVYMDRETPSNIFG